MTLVAILSIEPSQLAVFREFERSAARIMLRYGGRIERVVAIPAPAPGAPLKEVHLVTFPDHAAFRAYQQDPELTELMPVRAASLLRTELLIGEEAPSYY
jgi:uncharacterized protein (DUF1330 family)